MFIWKISGGAVAILQPTCLPAGRNLRCAVEMDLCRGPYTQYTRLPQSFPRSIVVLIRTAPQVPIPSQSPLSASRRTKKASRVLGTLLLHWITGSESDPLDVDGARTLFGRLHFEGDRVPHVELGKGHADEGGRVEKDIFLLSFLTDEPEPLFGQALDCSVHTIVCHWLNNPGVSALACTRPLSTPHTDFPDRIHSSNGNVEQGRDCTQKRD